jgi:predicted XRE-type DNA-binding protein
VITIEFFHFSKEKSGMILKKWLKDAGLSQHHAAKLTGIHEDTLSNCLSGRVQDIKFEIVFKLAVITGHTVDDYIRAMLDGEETGFYCAIPPQDAPDPAASTPLSEIDRLSAAHEKELAMLSQVYERQIERIESIFAARISDLKADLHALKKELSEK